MKATDGRQAILAIDDEPLVLECLRHSLDQAGYQVLTTTNPEEFLRLVTSRSDLALVLLDVMMPDKDGFQLYREVRALCNIPTLFVTGYPQSFNAQLDSVRRMWQEEFADGTTDILYKPFTYDGLLDKVQGLIGDLAGA